MKRFISTSNTLRARRLHAGAVWVCQCHYAALQLFGQRRGRRIAGAARLRSLEAVRRIATRDRLRPRRRRSTPCSPRRAAITSSSAGGRWLRARLSTVDPLSSLATDQSCPPLAVRCFLLTPRRWRSGFRLRWRLPPRRIAEVAPGSTPPWPARRTAACQGRAPESVHRH